MNLFEFIITFSWFIFILLWIDLYKRKKFNFFHFLVFLWWGIAITIFALDNSILNAFWGFFWLARGADLLVYMGIVILFYFYLSLLNKETKDVHNLTRLVSSLAIQEAYSSHKKKINTYKNITKKDEYVLHIRAYNEWKKIGEVIDEIISEGFKKIIFINDGSSDDTLSILQKKQEKHPECLLIIISHSINRWWWAANQTWYKFVQEYGEELQIKWFVGFDADGQMDIKDMEKFISAIKKTWDKVGLYLGSRFVNGAKVKNMPLSRKIILKISKLVTRIFYGTKTSDPHNGFRVMNLDTLKKFNIRADGMHYANEINEQINFHKIKYQEIPVNIRYTDYSLSKGQKNSNSIKLAFEMIYKKIFFR